VNLVIPQSYPTTYETLSKAVQFQEEVLKTKALYSDADFAVIQGYGGEWMLHADHTYQGHALEKKLAGLSMRGTGVELRLHGCDPDTAATAAKKLGFEVLSKPEDKPYELRETHVVDADGYVWVADVPAKTQPTQEKQP